MRQFHVAFGLLALSTADMLAADMFVRQAWAVDVPARGNGGAGPQRLMERSRPGPWLSPCHVHKCALLEGTMRGRIVGHRMAGHHHAPGRRLRISHHFGPTPATLLPGTSIWTHAGDDAHQVSIEQRFSIRVMPAGPALPPDMLMEQHGKNSIHSLEHKTRKCLPWNNIVSVQNIVEDRLLIFMNDQRTVSVEFWKMCQIRDFYSGFLFERTRDGRICAGRDVLQARSGTNCRIKKLHVLVEATPHR